MKHFWKNKKVLVLGAGGFIGSHVVDKLLEEGSQVTAQISKNRKNLGKALISNRNLKISKGDLLDLDYCIYISKNKDIILNFAALDGGSKFKREYSAEIFKNNSQITVNVLEACVKNNVERVLLVSSIAVYPDNFARPMEENLGVIDDSAGDLDGYSWSKKFLEKTAQIYSSQHKVKVAIIRPSNVYGPRDHLDKGRVVPTFIKQAVSNLPITVWNGGKQKMAFIYVTDLVQGALNVVEKYSECTPVNIGSETYISIANLAKLIIKLTGSKSKLTNIKSQTKFKNRILDISKIKKITNFSEKVDLNSGLLKTIDYLKRGSS